MNLNGILLYSLISSLSWHHQRQRLLPAPNWNKLREPQLAIKQSMKDAETLIPKWYISNKSFA